jgi:hypothetical protein
VHARCFAPVSTILKAWFRFADQHTAAYYGTCALLGLAIRWFWCDQDLARFLNPLAPLFA